VDSKPGMFTGAASNQAWGEKATKEKKESKGSQVAGTQTIPIRTNQKRQGSRRRALKTLLVAGVRGTSDGLLGGREKSRENGPELALG